MVEKRQNRFIFFLVLVILFFIFSLSWRYFETLKDKDNFLSLSSRNNILNKLNYQAIARWHNADFSSISIYSTDLLGEVLEEKLDKPILIYFTTDWCLSCQKELESVIYPLAGNRRDLSLMVLNFDLKFSSRDEKLLARYFSIKRPGNKILLTNDGWLNLGTEFWSPRDLIEKTRLN